MKRPFSRRSIIALVLMATSAWLASAATPTVMLADMRPPVLLTTVFPTSFGDWHEDMQASNVMVEPALQRAIDATYTQTLARIYVNGRGERIMLSVAYGRDQSNSLQIHLPEGCYQGQGFAVTASAPALLVTSYGLISAQHMLAQRDVRREPVTYWVVVGNRFATDEWQRRKIKLAYALKRTVPDGILIRVSSISGDTDRAFLQQQKFIDAMLAASPARQRQVLLGAQGT